VTSLRKTLPVPDGAVVWSPRGEDLPASTGDESTAAQWKLVAMILKAAWLSGKNVSKTEFRYLQQTGEVGLRDCAAQPTTFTRAVLPLLDVWRLRSVRADNARELIASLTPRSSEAWRPLTYGPPGAVPFNVQILCASEAVRDALLGHLAGERIFAPVHWRQPRTELCSGDEAAVDYASRILTVPVDHRYRASDIHRIAEALRTFAPPAPPFGQTRIHG
jgi:hypothetical protein